jgi:hypothetical protein
MSYEEMVKAIKEAPMTWIPSLLFETVKAGYEKGMFMPFGASRIANQLENGALNELVAKTMEKERAKASQPKNPS